MLSRFDRLAGFLPLFRKLEILAIYRFSNSIFRWYGNHHPLNLAIAKVPKNGNSIPSAPKLEPFPSWEMQKLGDCSAIQFVQSMQVLGKPVFTKMDEFQENFLTVCDSPKPLSSENKLWFFRIFMTNWLHQHQICYPLFEVFFFQNSWTKFQFGWFFGKFLKPQDDC